MIKVIYNKTCGRCVQSEPLTSGMVGQTIEFECSADFDGLTLTAVFTNGKTTVDVLNPGAQCMIPHEVLGTVGTLVKVGIYAVRGNEIVIPTVYANIGVVLKGADPSGDVSADPTLPVWAQIQGIIGNLSDLDTEAKNNLVAAINEAAQTGSGGGGGSSIALDTTLTQSGKAADAKAVGDALAGKQDTISDLEAIRTGAAKGATALQSVPSTYRTASEQDTIDSGKVDKVTGKGLSSNDYTDAAKAKVDALAPVATSGSYNDLTDKPTPLIGTTAELTPTQVYNAVSAGIPVKVQYFDDTYGILSFTTFNAAESLYTIVSQTIVYYNGVYVLAELSGGIQTGMWLFNSTVLAEKKDIPSALPNPNALTFTGAVTGSYDGSAPMTVNIPEGGGGGGGAGAKELRLVRSITLEEQSDRVDISVDSSGNAFALHEVYVMIAAQSYEDAYHEVNFLPNGRWGSSDAFIVSANKSSKSSETWKNNMAFHSVYADGVICSEQLPSKGEFKNLSSNFAINQAIITKISLVCKFAAGCTFLVIGR